MKRKIKGRAEYENINDCFEGVSAKFLLAPLFKNSDTKMIIGDSGTGKTHSAILLAKELPVEIYHLNKDHLPQGIVEYSLLKENKDANAVIVDDLHYLFKFMQISSKINEEDVLGMLEKMCQDVRETKAIPIFVADEGPAGLAMRFKKDENRARCLRLLDGCTDTVDDSQYFSMYLGKNYRNPRNTINLNYRFLSPWIYWDDIWKDDNGIFCDDIKIFKDYDLENGISTIRNEVDRQVREGISERNIVKKFKMFDIPLWYPSYPYTTDYEILYPISMRGYIINNPISHCENNIIRIKFCYKEGEVITNNPIYDNEGRAIGKIIHDRDYGEFMKLGLARVTPLATIRELEVVAKECGGINRKSLSIDFGHGTDNCVELPKDWRKYITPGSINEGQYKYLKDLYPNLHIQVGYEIKKNDNKSFYIPDRYYVKNGYLWGLRQAIGLWFDPNIEEDPEKSYVSGIIYTINEMKKMQNIIKREFYNHSGYMPDDVIRAFISAPDDEEAMKILVGSELKVE